MRVLVYPLQQSRVAEKGINAERDIGKQRPPYPLTEYLRSVAVEGHRSAVYHEPVLYEALVPKVIALKREQPILLRIRSIAEPSQVPPRKDISPSIWVWLAFH